MTIRPRPALPCLFAGRLRAAILAAPLVALAAAPALAETLRCRSVNGNVTCSGSGAFSCQTVNGRTTCVTGDGAVVQQFGRAARPAPSPSPDEAEAEEPDLPPAEALPMPFHGRRPLALERRGPAGQWLHLERDGSRLRLRTERLAVDLD